MIKRVVYCGSRSHLKVRNRQLVIVNRESDEESSIPVEDIGFLELDNSQITLSVAALQCLLANNVAVSIGDTSHQPLGLALAFYSNSIHTKRVNVQACVTAQAKKRIWRQIVCGKILNQISLLASLGRDSKPLPHLLGKVKSGDPDNIEAVSSRYYWQKLFQNRKFKRERFGSYPNNLLNYGYAVLRSIVARGLVSTGLHPALGIHHHNKYNPYCLADDLMEPFRPFVDARIMDIYDDDEEEVVLERDVKRSILDFLFADVTLDGQIHPLWNAVRITCVSLFRCMENRMAKLELPRFVLDEKHLQK